MKEGVQFLVILGLALFVITPTIASDSFNILSIPSHGENDSELARPTVAEDIEASGRVRLGQNFVPFDYYRLVVQWPTSHCNTGTTRCAVSLLPQTFTIHGLWPDIFTGPLLRSCVPNNRFVPITDRTLLQSMNDNWPDIQRGRNSDFWKAQWENHGTCSLFLHQQTDFLYLAINLKNRYNILDALRQNSILPDGSSYSVTGISAAIRQITSKDPDIGCNKDNTKRQQLHEIHICFTPLGSVRDCPADRLSRAARCTATDIFFPNP